MGQSTKVQLYSVQICSLLKNLNHVNSRIRTSSIKSRSRSPPTPPGTPPCLPGLLEQFAIALASAGTSRVVPGSISAQWKSNNRPQSFILISGAHESFWYRFGLYEPYHGPFNNSSFLRILKDAAILRIFLF